MIQAASKILRFGPDSWHPEDLERTCARLRLQQEIGDVLAMIEVILKDTDLGLSEEGLETAKQKKLEKLAIWLP